MIRDHPLLCTARERPETSADRRRTAERSPRGRLCSDQRQSLRPTALSATAPVPQPSCSTYPLSPARTNVPFLRLAIVSPGTAAARRGWHAVQATSPSTLISTSIPATTSSEALPVAGRVRSASQADLDVDGDGDASGSAGREFTPSSTSASNSRQQAQQQQQQQHRSRQVKRRRHAHHYPRSGRHSLTRHDMMQPGSSSAGPSAASGDASGSSKFDGDGSAANGASTSTSSFHTNSTSASRAAFSNGHENGNGHADLDEGASTSVPPHRLTPLYPGSTIDREELVRLTLQCLQDAGYA